MPQLLDGKLLSENIRKELCRKIEVIPDDAPSIPHLVAILVGYDAASQVYIKQKRLACDEVGIKFTLYHLADKTTTTTDVLTLIDRINSDPNVHGCLVQLPLPGHINTDQVIERVSPKKDVDGFHPMNIGKLLLHKDTFIPATPYGIYLLLKHYNIPTEGKHVVILGKSLIVGQPLMNLLASEADARSTVTCCDKYTPDIKEHTKRADIIIVATGVRHLLKDPDSVKNGVVIVDVGIHRINDKIEGDVDFQTLKDKCSYITPVPGGVGPMTVVSLLLNTWKAFYQGELIPKN